MNEKIKNRLEIEINKSYYSHKRYKVDTTFALLYYDHEISIEALGNFIRISDQLLQIDEHHYFINFIHTPLNGAFKASENLLLTLDKYFNDQKSLIALNTLNTTQTPSLVIHKLYQILTEIEKNPYSRIDDENILNDLI